MSTGSNSSAAPERQDTPWTVLLIGGNSGAGKSTVARTIARRVGADWVQVDDFRLALQRVTSPESVPALHFGFDAQRYNADELRDGLIGVAEALSPALEIVVANHVALNDPLVLEGDGIPPSFAARTVFAGQDARSLVRSVFLVEDDADALLRAMRARGRGFGERSDRERSAIVEMNLCYGRWLRDEAEKLGLPVVESRPWDSLLERALEAAEAG